MCLQKYFFKIYWCDCDRLYFILMNSVRNFSRIFINIISDVAIIDISGIEISIDIVYLAWSIPIEVGQIQHRIVKVQSWHSGH